jgi:hypothetical protein
LAEAAIAPKISVIAWILRMNSRCREIPLINT